MLKEPEKIKFIKTFILQQVVPSRLENFFFLNIIIMFEQGPKDLEALKHFFLSRYLFSCCWINEFVEIFQLESLCRASPTKILVSFKMQYVKGQPDIPKVSRSSTS